MTDGWCMCGVVTDMGDGTCGTCGLRMMTDDEETPTLPAYLSPSQINGLLTCGEQYRLTRVEHVPERPMWAGIGGNTVHKLTEIHDLALYLEGKA